MRPEAVGARGRSPWTGLFTSTPSLALMGEGRGEGVECIPSLRAHPHPTSPLKGKETLCTQSVRHVNIPG